MKLSRNVPPSRLRTGSWLATTKQALSSPARLKADVNPRVVRAKALVPSIVLNFFKASLSRSYIQPASRIPSLARPLLFDIPHPARVHE
jgi:hypothetical protein